MASPAPSAFPPCPDCGNTGWRRLAAGSAARPGIAPVARCECQFAHRGEQLLAEARIPPRYAHCTLQNFDAPEGAAELKWAHAQAVGYARDYPGNLDRERSGLLFCGGVGVGKTHLAVAIAHQLIERGIGCRFCDHRDLLKRIQATFDPATPGTEAGVVAPLLAAEVLILDDLGVGRATEWALETLHYLLNDRYSQNRATLITTNLEDGDAGPAPSETGPGSGGREPQKMPLGLAVGERLRSRLYEMCRFVPMHGGDFRRATAPPILR